MDKVIAWLKEWQFTPHFVAFLLGFVLGLMV